MSKRILLVTTSHAIKGSTGLPTGAYLSEIAHPYNVFARAGFAIDLASPKGGTVPLDGVDEADEASKLFLAAHRADLERTIAARDVDPLRYDAIFYAGGHGAMWDLPDNVELARIAATIYERGGIVSAVCHGPAALVNIQLSNGSYLVAGKTVSAFTNDEERAIKLDTIVPWLLAAKLEERGARHEGAPMWQAKVVVSERLVTGQNPASAEGVAKAVVAALDAANTTELPPRNEAPAGAKPVVVTLRLRAKDPTSFCAHLQAVIPVTRKAAGNRFSWSSQDGNAFTLTQGWDSRAQQEAYLAWRERRGDLKQLVDQLERAPDVEIQEAFDR
ncbi:MAG: type 1 glutamine amidotransferase domain-containing protein [Kofleriaceae bacterium]